MAVMLPKAENLETVMTVAAATSHPAARSELLIASRLAEQTAGIDGVTVDFQDFERVRTDALYTAALGLSDKLFIHPAQIEDARVSFRPSSEEIAWARRISTPEDNASAIDDQLVGAPVRQRAGCVGGSGQPHSPPGS